MNQKISMSYFLPIKVNNYYADTKDTLLVTLWMHFES